MGAHPTQQPKDWTEEHLHFNYMYFFLPFSCIHVCASSMTESNHVLFMLHVSFLAYAQKQTFTNRQQNFDFDYLYWV